jgi:uncharacterized protein (DUF2147 family)
MPETVKTWIVFVVGLAMLGLGWLIGFLDSNRNSTKKIRSAELQAQIEIEEAKKMAAAASLKAAEAAKTAVGNSLLRLWADPAGQARLDLDGAQIDSPQVMLPDQRRRLIAILTQMRPWVEGAPAAPAAAPQPIPAAPVAPAAAAPARQAAPVTGKDKEKDEPPAPKSIVRQIDDVLQKRLAGTATGTRNIRLSESVTGGVEVWVGLQRYTGIDEVPDPEVVAAIRAAISEWETRAQ